MSGKNSELCPNCGASLNFEWQGVQEGVAMVCPNCGWRSQPFYANIADYDRVLNYIQSQWI